MKYKDYYQVMGLERGATDDEIKQAYRKLARKYHPDISKDPQGKEKFQEIGEAYATLKDPEKRQAYDDLGKRPAGQQFTPPPDWQQDFYAGQNRGNNGRSGAEYSGYDDVDMADLFAQFGRSQQGGRQRENMPMRGQDFEVIAQVSLEQIFQGAEIEVRAALPEYDGNGLAHRVAHTFRITIPKGAADGQRLRLNGKGGHGIHGGRAGDLYVALALQAHPLYKLSERDLYIDLPLAPWEAVLGATVRVPTLTSAIELNIKAGTVNGQKFRIPKHGMLKADGSVGTLYAVVKIEVPHSIEPEEKTLFEQLAKTSRFSPRPHFSSGV